jgi:NAD(P)-dependent dehydrogenase (short-subunit alcohol dehydrogenase family)
MRIENHTAIVTGGSSGLGAATAKMVVAAGGNSVILDINQSEGEKIADELGDRALFVQTDITQEQDVKAALVKAKEKFGEIHFCANCAGTGWATRTISKQGPHDLSLFETVVRINLIGTFNVASKVAFEMSGNSPGVTGERGVIVNVSSLAAFEGQIGQVAYAASKAGIVGMTLPMARDLGKLGIRVVTIAPGFFDTPMTRLFPAEQRDRLVEQIPFPKEIANPAAFAHMVEHIFNNRLLNGETIRLDGGLRMPVA